MAKASAVLVLVGDSTKNLFRFVRWELDLAQSMDKPIIVVNLNGKREQDEKLVPPILRNECIVHVDFRMKIIKYALDNWPAEYRRLKGGREACVARYYPASIYAGLGLKD